VFEDLQGNVALGKVPGVNAPSWTTWNFGIAGGVEFAVLGFAVNNYLDFTLQTRHAMKLNVVLDNHIHFAVPANDAGKKFKFQLDVIAAGVGAAFAKPAGSPFTAEYTLAANDSGKHLLLDLADIPALNTTLSSLYVCRLSRIAASATEYGSAVYVLFNDSHYERDSLGSAEEYVK